MARRSRTGSRLAVILLALLCLLLLVILAACPPSGRRLSGSPATVKPAPQERPPAEQPVAEPVEEPHEEPVEGQAESPVPLVPTTPPQPRPEIRGSMAVVIDDAGYDLKDLEPFLQLPIPLAVAVLPNLPNSREAARRVIAAGKTLLVHMPMEPEGGENPGPGALRTTDTPEETRRLLEAAFATVPGAVGMNNHMGSRATADEELMRRVLAFLGGRDMFFLDSRTTAETVGAGVAGTLGVPSLERDVFIDAANSNEQISQAFQAGIARSLRTGSAVLIGHVQNPGVLAILRSSAGALREAGVRLTPLSAILKKRNGD